MPQGSVLGPILYLLYTSPLGDIIRSHGLDLHFYADDSQLYLAFESTVEGKLRALAQIEMCAKEIDIWMVKNRLKLNGNKTELLIIKSRSDLSPVIENIEVSNSTIQPITSAYNIGVTFHVHEQTHHKHLQKLFLPFKENSENKGLPINVRHSNTSSCLHYI